MQTTDVRETAQNAVNQGKSLLGKQVDDRSTMIGQQIGSVAQDLRNVGDQLRQSGTVGLAAGYVDQGAELVERLGQYLQDADSERLIGDLENYARKQPWAIAAAALVLGFAASRFLKTSSARRYRGYDDSEGGGSSYGASGTSYGSGSKYGSSYGETTYGDGTGVRTGGTRYAT
ncbi:MAG: hypothetical protein QOJ39_128 [Candidatus Eremiobacteraeota bacterium]|jgi:hypothetical protein|nr:hypothetical protein [Candidatus Eremiobacteraeota bacterium]